MASEQNKFSQDPSSTAGTGASPANKPGQSTASATQKQKDTSTSNMGSSTPTSNISGSSSTPNLGGSMQQAPAGGTGDSGTINGKSILDQAKSTAGQAYDAVAEKATTKLDEQKSTLSGGLSSVADSLRQVGENLQGADVQDGIGKYAREYSNTAAQKIEQAASYFERKDVKEMYRDVESFARSNPTAFIGAAFAVGLLAARFLKSSSPGNTMHRSDRALDSQRPFNKGLGSGETRPSATPFN